MSRRASLMPTFAAVAILIVLLISAQARFPKFLSPGNMSALLLDNAYLVVLAVGLTFVILTGGIDLSVGSVMAFTGILGASLLAQGTPAVIAVPVMLVAGALIGLLIGVLVHYFNVQPFIASLAGLFLARGLAFVVSLSSIRVEDPAVLWLQRTRFQLGGLVHHPDRHHRAAGRRDRVPRAACGRGSAAPCTRSAAASSPRGSWA